MSIKQATAPPKSLYDRDLDLWLETTIAQLKAGDFHSIDVESLLEELEGLSGSNKREMETRLKRLIEHILKRCYITLPECFRGWEVTIINQRDELTRLFRQSPSLKRHFIRMFDDCFDIALKIVRTEYDEVEFPSSWLFERDIDSVLTVGFWMS